MEELSSNFIFPSPYIDYIKDLNINKLLDFYINNVRLFRHCDHFKQKYSA